MQDLGLLGGPLLATATGLLLPDAVSLPDGGALAVTAAARASAAAAVWMAVWWMTEAIPIYATALLPLALFPLSGARTLRDTASPYAHELIFLFLGGFLLALAMQRWGLHRRIALGVLGRVGTSPRRMVAGFMAVTAGLSMWVSNTATTLTMLPIALSALASARPAGEQDTPAGRQAQRNLARCLLLGIAYAASIGGVGTLTGTPPNLFLASFAREQLGLEISFVRWMSVGVPLVLVFLPLGWWLLTRVLFPLPDGDAAPAPAALEAPGAWSRGERAVLVVFLATASGWMLRPLLARLHVAGVEPLAGLSDTGIAILAALVLFALPVDRKAGVFVLDWDTALQVPWGVLLLFGGGLSLAAALHETGVTALVGAQVGGLAGVSPLLVIGICTALTIFLTELTSNTATATTLLPILVGLAPGLGLDPLLLLVPAALAASCAFMLPVATPPNAIVFGSGRVRMADMVRAGLWLNLIGVVLITALARWLVLPLLGP